MDSYDLKQDVDQALDFTSSSKEKFNEAPVLDLSFKKSPDNHGISYSLSPSPSENRSLSPSSNSNAEQHHNNNNHHHENQRRHSHNNTSEFINDDEKDLYEERSYIVTPPPDHDSPKKIKYDYSGLTEEQMMYRYAMSQMNIPVQVASIIPPSMAAQNGGSVRQMHVPVSPAAIATSSSSSSSTTTPSHNDLSLEQSRKAPRPFKAYPKDPLSLSMGPELMYDQKSNEQYTEFRRRMLESVRRSNEGTNIKMRRTTSKSPVLPTSTMDEKDSAYWERRRKNNEAAKRSRDARRAKEDEIAIRAAFLEQENLKLKYELVTLRQEHAKLRCLVYSN